MRELDVEHKHQDRSLYLGELAKDMDKGSEIKDEKKEQKNSRRTVVVGSIVVVVIPGWIACV